MPRRAARSSAIKFPKQGFSWTTYAERLEKAGISWKTYQQADNYGTNMLETFNQFRNAPKDSPLYLKGCVRGPEGQFEYDAMNDKLPAVSWIFPPSYQSEHPDYMPADGAAFVASTTRRHRGKSRSLGEDRVHFELRRKRRDLRSRRAACAATGHAAGIRSRLADRCRLSRAVHHRFRLGRAGGWVCSQPFDHTSVLQFLGKIHRRARRQHQRVGDVKPLAISLPPSVSTKTSRRNQIFLTQRDVWNPRFTNLCICPNRFCPARIKSCPRKKKATANACRRRRKPEVFLTANWR